MALYKTTIIIWSEYPGDSEELEYLARDADSGDAYCSKQVSVLVEDPKDDPDWDGTEFFGIDDEDGDADWNGMELFMDPDKHLDQA